MRDKERAMIERLKEIVQFVEGLGKGIAVVENGDCQGWEDAKRVREVTGIFLFSFCDAGFINFVDACAQGLIQ